ncbi:RDD family protein [Niabella aurantiaca]|uniref:RDD family protein n=1 Tax=Niabella aurantiaca TaxID=379900 RepID=UPI0003AA8DC2|nr:RDD family protein [Niabella aurantiaca]
MNQESTTSPEFSLFENDFSYMRASTGKRLLNYIIDVIVFYVLIFILAFLLAALSPQIAAFLISDDPGPSLLSTLFYLALYALYMGSAESLLKGKTLGKYLTRTRAVNLDGSPISTRTAFLRGFSRATPFCAFSALGSPCDPWQDRWTKTLVVDEQQSNLPGSDLNA